MSKLYRFKATNWKNWYSKPMYFYKRFHSAYYADKWTMKFICNPNSQYIVTLQICEEVE